MGFSRQEYRSGLPFLSLSEESEAPGCDRRASEFPPYAEREHRKQRPGLWESIYDGTVTSHQRRTQHQPQAHPSQPSSAWRGGSQVLWAGLPRPTGSLCVSLSHDGNRRVGRKSHSSGPKASSGLTGRSSCLCWGVRGGTRPQVLPDPSYA